MVNLKCRLVISRFFHFCVVLYVVISQNWGLRIVLSLGTPYFNLRMALGSHFLCKASSFLVAGDVEVGAAAFPSYFVQLQLRGDSSESQSK